jgi:hypothetical protein
VRKKARRKILTLRENAAGPISVRFLLEGYENNTHAASIKPSCSAPVRQELSRQSQEQENLSARAAQKAQAQLKPVAGDRSEPLFAETIDERAKAANLLPLKSKKLNGDDLEFRVWVGFGKKPLEGFVIERADGQWKGTFLESMNATTRPPYRRQLSSPESGWEELWSQVVDSGFLSLPDSSQLKGEVGVLDGTSYVVEVKKDGLYRTYAYLNPDHQTWKEAKQMLKIAGILYTGFGVER